MVYTQDWHGEDGPEFAVWGESMHAPGRGGRRSSTRKRPTTVTRSSASCDAFYGTPLGHGLRVLGVEELVIVSMVANICVLHTAGSVALRHFGVTLVEDAVGALHPFDHAATLRRVVFLCRGRVTRRAGVSFDAA